MSIWAVWRDEAGRLGEPGTACPVRRFSAEIPAIPAEEGDPVVLDPGHTQQVDRNDVRVDAEHGGHVGEP